jgi:hypothetical protein
MSGAVHPTFDVKIVSHQIKTFFITNERRILVITMFDLLLYEGSSKGGTDGKGSTEGKDS